jgi:hypothetical protein
MFKLYVPIPMVSINRWKRQGEEIVGKSTAPTLATVGKKPL